MRVFSLFLVVCLLLGGSHGSGLFNKDLVTSCDVICGSTSVEPTTSMPTSSSSPGTATASPSTSMPGSTSATASSSVVNSIQPTSTMGEASSTTSENSVMITSSVMNPVVTSSEMLSSFDLSTSLFTTDFPMSSTSAIDESTSTLPSSTAVPGSCSTICSTITPTVTPTVTTTEPSPTAAPAGRKANVGLAVGLTILALAIVIVIIAVAAFFIYKKYGKYRGDYQSLPSEK